MYKSSPNHLDLHNDQVKNQMLVITASQGRDEISKSYNIVGTVRYHLLQHRELGLHKELVLGRVTLEEVPA